MNTDPFFVRHPANPILVPGGPEWRRAVVFNPGVWHDGHRFHLFERAAGGLRPFICSIGYQRSEDGVHFELGSPEPVLTPEMCGSALGSVQDPRVAMIDGRFLMTFAFRPYAWSSSPTAVGVPDSWETEFPGVVRAPIDPAQPGSANVRGGRPDNHTRSGLAVSHNLREWSFDRWLTPPEVDDRDVILFPRKVGGRFLLLRRPLWTVSPGAEGSPAVPSIWISSSADLESWTGPEVLAEPCFGWECGRIGGSTPPIETEEGWLVFYHGVEMRDSKVRAVTYRMGAMLLDLEDPRRVLARCPDPLFEPELYYERFGAYIPDVVFPTGVVVLGDVLWLYYGVCDTAIALAQGSLSRILKHLRRYRVRG